METSRQLSSPSVPTVGCTVPVWLPVATRIVFESHVGKDQGKRGRYGKDAIVEKLQRDGAFVVKQTDKAAEVIKAAPPEALPLLLEVVELISARGPGVVRDMLEGLKHNALETEGARR